MPDELNFKISPEIYPTEKEKANRQTVWEHYFARKIAFFIAPILLRLGASANLVSFSSITIGVIAAALIALGNFWVVLLGVILMQVWLILDKTDGIIARSRKAANKFGEFFEELNGDTIAALFFSSIGLAASKFPGLLVSCLQLPLYLFIILGILTSLFVVFRHLLSRYFEAIFLEGQETKSESSLWYKTVVKFSGIYSLAQPLLILAVIFNFLGLYISAYFIIQGILMLVSLFSLIYKGMKRI